MNDDVFLHWKNDSCDLIEAVFGQVKCINPLFMCMKNVRFSIAVTCFFSFKLYFFFVLKERLQLLPSDRNMSAGEGTRNCNKCNISVL